MDWLWQDNQEHGGRHRRDRLDRRRELIEDGVGCDGHLEAEVSLISDILALQSSHLPTQNLFHMVQSVIQ